MYQYKNMENYIRKVQSKNTQTIPNLANLKKNSMILLDTMRTFREPISVGRLVKLVAELNNVSSILS